MLKPLITNLATDPPDGSLELMRLGAAFPAEVR
jgi:hypothetical protein